MEYIPVHTPYQLVAAMHQKFFTNRINHEEEEEEVEEAPNSLREFLKMCRQENDLFIVKLHFKTLQPYILLPQ